MSPLWVIINQTLNTGINPDKLKIAKVIALCTKDNKSKTDNYRPISLLDLNLENIRRAISRLGPKIFASCDSQAYQNCFFTTKFYLTYEKFDK